MEASMRIAIVGAALLALSLAGVATAQTGALCQAHGNATISPGFTGAPGLEDDTFTFTGTLHDCQQSAVDCEGATVAASGTTTGNCPGSTQTGTVTIQKLDANNVNTCPFSYPITGACVGAVCTGGAPGLPNAAAYVLVFTADTVTSALEACSDFMNPPHLTDAEFDGVIGLSQ